MGADDAAQPKKKLSLMSGGGSILQTVGSILQDLIGDWDFFSYGCAASVRGVVNVEVCDGDHVAVRHPQVSGGTEKRYPRCDLIHADGSLHYEGFIGRLS